MVKVYCAGPLFNASERGEMSAIADTLERTGFSTFLPHRDGLEFAELKPELERLGVSADEAIGMINRAIFSMDTYQLLDQCDAVVANLNGRVPDEGTVVEAALAWHSEKPLVLYKADARALLDGADNPMLTGLGNFEWSSDINALPDAITRAIQNRSRTQVAQAMTLGASIASIRRGTQDMKELAKALLQSRARA